MAEPVIDINTSVLTPEQAKKLVDVYSKSLFEWRTSQASSVHGNYERLWKTISTLFTAGGKRLRPYMTLLTYQAYSHKPVTNILPAAVAQEMLHQAMLMHDDIIDRDTMRYHVKNISGQYRDIYKDAPDAGHFADSSAMLAGDLLISEAHIQVALADVSPEILTKAQDVLNQAVFHVIGGELLDTEASFSEDSHIDPLTILEQKTASYSFVGPLTMGATLAGASDEQIGLLKHFGTSIGIAYQLRDDILGIFGNQEITGKSTEGDLREKKRTLLIDEFYKRASDEQRAQFDAIFGSKDATTEDIQTLRDLLTHSGARSAIEAYIESYKQQTIEHMDELAITDDYRQQFVTLIEKSLDREN
ncbi:MAG: crtE [Candidatus Saccharibacteria bacterium]|nr:crtE [Candidatus Saccharibacteria bacterium]